jgi:hypothetical protein
MTITRIRPTIDHDDVLRCEVALVVKACEQRLKPVDKQAPLPCWAEEAPDWDWIIQLFLQDYTYNTVVRYAATPAIAFEFKALAVHDATSVAADPATVQPTSPLDNV